MEVKSMLQYLNKKLKSETALTLQDIKHMQGAYKDLTECQALQSYALLRGPIDNADHLSNTESCCVLRDGWGGNCKKHIFFFIFFYFHHLSHFGEGLPQLAYNQAETPGR
jgi:hypothetical protein